MTSRTLRAGMPSVIVRVGASWVPIHLVLIGVMPAQRASVPDSPAIPTHNERDIHQDTARSRLRLALILVASFMVVLDFTIVNIALPSMERDLGVGTSVVQWVVTGYAIAFSGLLILGGRAADMLGRRRIFIVGLVVFSLASLAGGLAGDPVLLVASRIVQGAGAALVAPAALSLITTSVPAGPRRTRAIGLYGSMASVGFVAGQVLGGVLVEWTSWRAVFLVNVPVGLAAAFLAPRLIAVPAAERAAGARSQRGRRLDVRGAVLITAAVALAVFGISQGDVLGWTSPLVLGAAVIAVAAAACFVVAETRHPGAARPAPPAAPPRPAQRRGAGLPARRVERRRAARALAVHAAGAAVLAARHRADHRTAGHGGVHHGHARPAARGPIRRAPRCDGRRRVRDDRLRRRSPSCPPLATARCYSW